jgi:6-phosphogluconolactonase
MNRIIRDTANLLVAAYSDAASAARAAAEEFVQLAAASQAEGRVFTVALSGGSTPRLFFAQLAAPECAARVNWPLVHLFWGDERLVPPTDEQSNYRLAHECLITKVPIPPANVHNPVIDLQDSEKTAAGYESQLKDLFSNWRLIRAGLPQFDLFYLGIGTDGHTASLFPETPALLETKRWVAANWVEKLSAHRITFTFPPINASRRIELLVSGADKNQRLLEILGSNSGSFHYPVQQLNPLAGRVVWRLDEQAAAGL